MELSSTGYTRNMRDVLQLRAMQTPNAMAYTFLKDGVTVDGSYTYAELDLHARAIAKELGPDAINQRILLIYPPGVEFLAGFYGAMYAGAIPIPAPPPDLARLKRTLPRLKSIIQDADAKYLMTTSGMAETIQGNQDTLAELPEIEWIATDEIDSALGAGWDSIPPKTLDDIAYLQYTSGSTSTPKGVMITYGNVMHNCMHLTEGFGYDENCTMVTWMPYFHDYGLIDGLSSPMYHGFPCYILSPLTFVRRPETWLDVISRYRATHTQAPNFAYELCVRRIDERVLDRLDLSCLITASTGGEPVRADTVRAFTKKFARCGMKPEVVCPACGLAESTLVISAKTKVGTPYFLTVDKNAYKNDIITPLDKDDPNGWALVSSGKILATVGVAIVDPATLKRLNDGIVGELWTSSDSVGAGYWQREEESEAVFRARIVGEEHLGTFLRTGDLAFVIDNQLFISGRAKDLVIIDGTNHYPQDIELTVQNADPAIRVDHCVAFSVDVDDRERLVIVAEAEKKVGDWTQVLRVLQKEISENHELELYALQIIRRGAIHKTSSGKLQRSTCKVAYLNNEFDPLFEWTRPSRPKINKATELTGPLATSDVISSSDFLQRSSMLRSVRNIIADELSMLPSELSDQRPLAEYGMSSRVAVMIAARLEELSSGRALSSTILWEHPTVEALVGHLIGSSTESYSEDNDSFDYGEPIAIIGMSCRFPGAADLDSFWDLLMKKGDAITEVPKDRWNPHHFYAQEAGTSGHINNVMGGFIDGIDQFDAAFFGISPSEAKVMDPQQRILLECTWHALEHAGLDVKKLAGSDTGVFVGISTNDYQELQMADRFGLNPYTGPGKSFSIAANRISYLFDFRGPSMSIDTACSSSLVAVHQAVQSLRRRESSTVLAAGVNLLITPEMSIALSQAQMLSPDGHCKSFDDGANGYVRSEGVGTVVLKRLSDAIKDGNHVIAIIRGSAINQDGRSNGLTAPNAQAQKEVVQKALYNAGLKPYQIGYVEAHGTGTALGDPIEVRALQEVLGKGRTDQTICRIGSVKSNIGHLEAAAGIAGLIKVALALSRETIPATAGFISLNRKIHVENTPFAIATDTTPWSGSDRYAGVSSFGFGGANAHIILEAATLTGSLAPAQLQTRRLFLPVSAATKHSLDVLLVHHAEILEGMDMAEAAAYCNAVAMARTALPLKAMFNGRDTHELVESIRTYRGTPKETEAASCVWLFTGQGSQYTGMARTWYEVIPAFKARIDDFDRLLRNHWPHSLLDLLWDASKFAALDDTQYTQAAIFAIQMAMVETLRSWGLKPDAVAGYSVGEYTAACAAGIFTPEDGINILAERGRLVQEHGLPGNMVAVMANEDQCNLIVSQIPLLEIATLNGPAGTVLAGPESALTRLQKHCEKEQIECRKLNVSHAFHTSLMKDVLTPFSDVLAKVAFSKASIPLISNLTGNFEQGEMSDAAYWIRHLVEPVRFGDSMQNLFDNRFETYLEIGPKPVLCGMASRFEGADQLNWVPIMRQNEDEQQVLSDALGSMWSLGVPADWLSFYGAPFDGSINLPLYPFDRSRYWIDASPSNPKHNPTAVSALVTSITTSNLIKGTLFESVLGVATHPFYADHKVFDVLVVPAAAHLALLMEATGKIWNDQPVLFEQVVFTKPLVMRESEPSVLHLLIEDSGSFALADDTDGHVSLCSGIVRRYDTPLVHTRSDLLSEIEQRCKHGLISDFYETHWQKNIALGPEFRFITEVQVGDRELLVSLSPVLAQNQLEDVHPGLIDSLLQALTVLVDTRDDEVTIPFSFDRVRYHRKSANAIGYKSHIRLTEFDLDKAVSDVCVWEVFDDGSSRILLEMDRFVALKVKKKLLLQDVHKEPKLPTYVLSWSPADHLMPFDIKADMPVSMFAYDGQNLLMQHSTPVLMFRSNPLVSSHSVASRLSGVAMELIEAAINCRDAGRSLMVITSGAQNTEDGIQVDAQQQSVAALVRQIEREILPGRLLQLDLPPNTLPSEGTATNEMGLFVSAASDRLMALQQTGLTELAWRNGELLVPQLHALSLPADGDEASAALQSVGRYVISGGSGALAIELAQWLVDQGVGAVDLLGRREMPASVATFIDSVATSSTKVRYEVVDITNSDDVNTVINSTDALPLRGIFHLAGTLNDCLLAEMTVAHFRDVLAPKIDGLMNLHTASLNVELDHFVVFSSASSTLTTPGQGNYAMANAFMDGFVAERRRQGLPGLSVSWGPFASGMAVGLEDHFNKQGIRLLDGDSVAKMASFLSPSTHPHLLVMHADWVAYASFNGAVSRLSSLSQPKQETLLKAVPNGFVSKLQAVSTEERGALLELEVRLQIAQFLHKPDPKALPARKRLFEMGLDSLGAVELKNRLSKALSHDLRSTLLFDYPTIEDLVAHLTMLLLGDDTSNGQGEVSTTNGHHQGAAHQGVTSEMRITVDTAAFELALDELSEDELADILRRELGDE
jgi:acyl transferase domain-containing protein/acyl-CoA synthetase (AMP-forming)/AMP-acid ligase II/acyl carrier protein